MSHSHDVATKRALRRVVGPELLSFTEDTTQAIRTLQAGLTTLHECHAADMIALQDADASGRARNEMTYNTLIAQLRRIDCHIDSYCDFRHRSFLARLRWLLTGR